MYYQSQLQKGLEEFLRKYKHIFVVSGNRIRYDEMLLWYLVSGRVFIELKERCRWYDEFKYRKFPLSNLFIATWWMR